MQNAYNNGYPHTYGNVLNLNGGGASQLFMGWEGNKIRGALFYRSMRDYTGDGTTWSNWGRIPSTTELYNNTSGSTGTITLSESAANFDYLEIFTDVGTIKIENPNGKTRTISCLEYSDTLYQNYTNITISGTTIKQNRAGNYYLNANHSGNKKIFKVIGYR